MKVQQDLYLVPMSVLRDIYETGINLGSKPEGDRYKYRGLEDIMKCNVEEGYVTKLELRLRMD